MTQIVRMYADRDTAMEAVRALVRAGFSRYDIHVVSPPEMEQGEPLSERLAGIAAMIHRGDVARERAQVYALAVNEGGTLVLVSALFGTARVIEGTLDGYPTIHPGYVEPVKQKRTLDKAAPFSSWLRLPVLLNNPTPFSNLMNMPVTSSVKAAPFSSWLKWPTLAGSAAPFSKYLGLKTLSDEPAPFSKFLMWPTLSGSAAPFSSWLKLPTLSGAAAPFSSWFRWPTLGGSATPFSDKLNLPTLSNDPAPLSSALGWKVLTDQDAEKKDG
jgi:hypothetical protein